VVSDTNDTIVLHSDEEAHFDDIKEVCKLYGFKFEGPTRHTSISYYWEWSFKIYIPMASENYPMMIEDYFNNLNIPLEDVMHERWVTKYRNKIAKIQKESNEALNELKFNRIYDKAVKYAWQRGDISLNEHYARLVDELTSEGVTYKKTLLRNKFMNEFAEDEYEDKAEVVALFA
jgi:hypothetical protein